MEALEINGKKYEPQPITMRMWRVLVAWDEKERKESPDLYARMDGYISIIALMINNNFIIKANFISYTTAIKKLI